VRTIIAAAVAAAPVVLLAGCTQDQVRPEVRDTAYWALSAATPLGPPIHCVEQERIRGHAVRDDRTIDFTLDDGSLLRNRLPYACSGLMRANRFTYRTALPRICSTDVITLVLPTGAGGGNCGLGMFQSVSIPPRPGRLPGAR
jgi:hypothetical protein